MYQTFSHYISSPNASDVNLDSAGITDGYKVEVFHSNIPLRIQQGRTREDHATLIEEFYNREALPAGLEKAEKDPLYGRKKLSSAKCTRILEYDISR